VSRWITQPPTIIIRQGKSLDTMVAQDRRAIKRVTRPMLGFNSFQAAQHTLAGIEVMHRRPTPQA
jgi:putative transposase